MSDLNLGAATILKHDSTGGHERQCYALGLHKFFIAETHHLVVDGNANALAINIIEPTHNIY